MPTIATLSAIAYYFVFISFMFVDCVWFSFRRKKRTKTSSSNGASDEENLSMEENVIQQQSNTKSELTRQPLRQQVSSPAKSDLTSSKRYDSGVKYLVDVSYKDNIPSKLLVVHEDKIHMIVPSQMSSEETLALLKAMSNYVSNDANFVLHSKKAPTVQKVVTYGVSDEITRRDKPVTFKADAVREFMSNEAGKHKLEPLLVKLLLNGPRRFLFDYDELKILLERGTQVYASESSLLEVPVPCVLYGDIHGQYSDLHRWLNLNGWPNQTKCAFLGDFVDRGSHGVEVVALITALKLTFPKQVFVIRGNHEEESLNRNYSFYAEVCQRFKGRCEEDQDGSKMYGYFKQLFMQLPLAVIVGYRVLGVHGGISPKLNTLQDIRDIKRPIDDFDVGSLECDLVWSDPDVDGKEKNAKTAPFRPNFDREPINGIGQLFNEESVKKVCKRLKIDLVIRGHQTPLHGYAFFADGKMITLFSAPGYKGVTAADVNMAAAIEFDRDMRMTIKKLKVSEQFRRNRISDCEQRTTLQTGKRTSAAKSTRTAIEHEGQHK